MTIKILPHLKRVACEILDFENFTDQLQRRAATTIIQKIQTFTQIFVIIQSKIGKTDRDVILRQQNATCRQCNVKWLIVHLPTRWFSCTPGSGDRDRIIPFHAAAKHIKRNITCYSAACVSQTRDQKLFTISDSEVATDWNELMVLELTNSWICSIQSAYTTTPVSCTTPSHRSQ